MASNEAQTAANDNLSYSPQSGSSSATPSTTAQGPSTAVPPLPDELKGAFLPFQAPSSPGVSTTAPDITRQEGGAPAPDARRVSKLVELLDTLQGSNKTAQTREMPAGRGRGAQFGAKGGTAVTGGPVVGGKPVGASEDATLDEELNLIAGGNSELTDAYKAGILTDEQKQKLVDGTTSRIYSLLGIKGRPKTGMTSEEILSQKVPKAMAASLKEQGVDITPTDSLGTVLDEVQRIAPGKDVTTGGQAIVEGPSYPGGAQRQSGADAYANLVKRYQDGNSAYQQGVQKDLEEAGLLDSTNGTPSATDVYTAYQAVIKEAAAQNVDVGTVVDNLAKKNQIAGGPQSEADSYVQDMATNYGITLTPEQVTSIADQFGGNVTTDSDAVKNAIVSFYQYNPNDTNSGVANDIANSIQGVAGQYFIPLSDQSLGTLVKSALKGASVESPYQTTENATAGYTEYAKQTASSLYPTLADAINRGITVQDAASPYAEVASSVLGVDPSTIDWSQAKWNAAFNTTDPQSGVPTTQSLSQWQKTLMSDPQYGYSKTQQAMDQASSMADALLNEFGKVAGTQSFGYSQSTSNVAG